MFNIATILLLLFTLLSLVSILLMKIFIEKDKDLAEKASGTMWKLNGGLFYLSIFILLVYFLRHFALTYLLYESLEPILYVGFNPIIFIIILVNNFIINVLYYKYAEISTYYESNNNEYLNEEQVKGLIRKDLIAIFSFIIILILSSFLLYSSLDIFNVTGKISYLNNGYLYYLTGAPLAHAFTFLDNIIEVNNVSITSYSISDLLTIISEGNVLLFQIIEILFILYIASLIISFLFYLMRLLNFINYFEVVNFYQLNVHYTKINSYFRMGASILIYTASIIFIVLYAKTITSSNVVVPVLIPIALMQLTIKLIEKSMGNNNSLLSLFDKNTDVDKSGKIYKKNDSNKNYVSFE